MHQSEAEGELGRQRSVGARLHSKRHPVEPRSIYDARLTDQQVEERQKLREELSQ
jgi:hypothetical protein